MKSSDRLSRRTLSKTIAGVASGVAAGAVVSKPALAHQASPESTPQASSGAIVSSVEGVPNAYTSYPEPFTTVPSPPGSGGTVRMLTLSYSPPPTPKEQNQFWQELEERLGVTYDADLVPIANYNEKIATVFAGGDLPELFYLLPSATRPLIFESFEQGAFADLTDFVSSDAIQEYPNLAAIPPYLWESMKVNGRVWGIPKAVLQNNDPTFYRKDWGDALGVPAFENAQQVSEYLVAAAKNDPDGNGTADTYGLSPYSGDWNAFLINQMFRVPYGWRLNDDGTLTNALETDEYKRALDFAKALYDAGAYHPDAASLTVEQASDLMVSGRTAMSTNGFAAVFGQTGYRTEIKEQVPTADLQPVILPGADGSKGVTYAGPGYFGLTAISAKAAQDEARFKELLGVLNYLVAPFGSEEATFLMYGIEGVHSEPAEGGGFTLTDQGRADRSALVYPFLSENYFFYPGLPGEAEFAQKFNEEMAAVAVSNPVRNVFSQTQGDVGAELGQFVTDKYTAFVTGREPIDTFSAFVDEWRSRGGDQIRSEYEEALRTAGT